MGHIFISYSKKDRALCMALADRLKDSGHEVWWDDNLPPGRDYAQIIEDKLRTADAAIVLWTRNSVRSKWVYFETEQVSLMGKLVPLKIGRCEVPIGLDRLQTYVYAPDDASAAPWQTLLRRIEDAIQQGKTAHSSVPTLDELTWLKMQKSRDPKDYSDFIERYPDSPRTPQVRLDLVKYRRQDQIRRWLWLVGGAIVYAFLWWPVITTFEDFGAAGAALWLTLYFHYFVFFVLFGAMMVPIYCLTLGKALGFGLSPFFMRKQPILGNICAIAVLIAIPLCMCSAVTYIETNDGYAPWQFNARIQHMPIRQYSAVDSDRSLVDIFGDTRTLTLKSLLESRNADPSVPVRCLVSGQMEPGESCAKKMQQLQTALEGKLHDNTWLSRTNGAYVASFFFFALTFLGSYVNIFFLCSMPRRARAWIAGTAPWGVQRYSQLLFLFAAQLLFIAVWFVARMIFQLETQTILVGDAGDNANAAIRSSYFAFIAVYFIGIGFVISAAFRLQNWQTRVGIVLLSILTALFLALSFSVSDFFRAMQTFIGARAGGPSILILAILVFFIFFIPLVLPNLFPRAEDETPG